MAMSIVAAAAAGQHVEHPVMSWWNAPLKHHRKWRGKGASQSMENRYNKNAYKGVKVREQGCQGGGYDPPRLKDLKKQNRLRTRKFYAKRRVPRSVPRAPFNDSTFLMRVRRSGGVEASSVVSPSPSPSVSVLSSPACSSYKLAACERVVDQNDYGYGSMTGLIHLRPVEDGDQSIGNNNTSSDDMCVEQQQEPSMSCGDDTVQELEQRLDRDVSRFEMIALPGRIPGDVMEERLTRQDIHIAHLEDENLVLKERLFLIQQEVDELRQRLQGGERCNFDESHDDDIDDTQSCFAR